MTEALSIVIACKAAAIVSGNNSTTLTGQMDGIQLDREAHEAVLRLKIPLSSKLSNHSSTSIDSLVCSSSSSRFVSSTLFLQSQPQVDKK
jgi:hypothetical protein